MEHSQFSSINIKDVRVNKKKNLIVVEAKEPEAALFEELVKVDKLGKWSVKCYLPKNEYYKAGVISPISIDADLEQIKDNIQQQFKVQDIMRLKRRNPTGIWEPSLTVKLVFAEEQLPTDVKIGYSFYKIRPYIGEPLQCFKCQRLGHTALGCRARVRCLLSSGEHPKEQCTARQEKCANCSGPHRANSKLCTLFKTACDIERTRVLNNESFETARKKVMSAAYGRNYEDSRNKEGRIEAHNAGIRDRTMIHRANRDILRVDTQYTLSGKSIGQSYRDVLQSKERSVNLAVSEVGTQERRQSQQYSDASTQTEKVSKEVVPLPDKEFFTKFKDFLLELFQGKIMDENIGAQSLLIESAMRNHFKINTMDAVQNKNVTTASSTNQGATSCGRDTVNSANQEGNDGMDDDSLEEGVISGNEVSSDNEVWKTIEKRQVKVLTDKIKKNAQTATKPFKKKAGSRKSKGSANSLSQ